MNTNISDNINTCRGSNYITISSTNSNNEAIGYNALNNNIHMSRTCPNVVFESSNLIFKNSDDNTEIRFSDLIDTIKQLDAMVKRLLLEKKCPPDFPEDMKNEILKHALVKLEN